MSRYESRAGNIKLWLAFFGCAMIAFIVGIGLMRIKLNQHPRGRGKDYTIQFIVPSNYRGVVFIDLDIVNGIDPAVRSHSTYTYDIPETGRLKVKTLSLFQEYHKMTARYADGRPLPTMESGGQGPAVTDESVDVALRGMGTITRSDDDQSYLLSVGTYDEFMMHQEKHGFR